MIKKFLLKQAAKIGTKGLPKDQQEVILKLIEKKPELFEKISKEIKVLTDKGTPEMYAAFEIMKKYEKDLQGAVTDSGLTQKEVESLARSKE